MVSRSMHPVANLSARSPPLDFSRACLGYLAFLLPDCCNPSIRGQELEIGTAAARLLHAAISSRMLQSPPSRLWGLHPTICSEYKEYIMFYCFASNSYMTAGALKYIPQGPGLPRRFLDNRRVLHALYCQEISDIVPHDIPNGNSRHHCP